MSSSSRRFRQTARRPIWATGYWTHGAQIAAAFVVTLLIYAAVIATTLTIFTPAQTRALLEVLIPSMVVLLAGMIAITPDRDRLRIRAMLAGDLRRVVESYRGERAVGVLDAVSVDHARAIILASARVERAIPPWLLWTLDFVLLLAGAWLGKEYAEAFRPPPLTGQWQLMAQIYAILVPVMVATSITLLARSFAKDERRYVERFYRLASQPSAYEQYLPMHRSRFKQKFNEDLDQAVLLAKAPEQSLQAVGHFAPSLRPTDSWRPNNLLDLSYTVFQLGAGLIIGALFEVLQ